MEAGDNRRSWASVLNYEGIGRGIERIFSGKDRKITRAATEDGNEVVKVREGVKPF